MIGIRVQVPRAFNALVIIINLLYCDYVHKVYHFLKPKSVFLEVHRKVQSLAFLLNARSE